MKKRVCFLCFLTGIALLLCACGVDESSFTDYSQYLRPASGNSAPSVPAAAPGDDFSSAVTVVSTPAPAVQQPVNTPAPTSTPGPFQTAATPPVRTPAPTPQQNLVQITKSPTSETVEAGGSAVFIAYADNSTGIVWITVSPDARTAYDINNAPGAFPGLQVSGQGTSVLTLSNIPSEMDGWRIQAYFNGNGGPLYTAGAYLTVIPAGAGTNPGVPAMPGTSDSVESVTLSVARQAYSDITAYASSYGYSVGSMDGYAYSSAVGDFNVTVSNVKCRITAEFRAYYYSSSNFGYGPVHVNIYNQLGELLYSEHLTDKNMSYYVTILDTYK